MELPAEVMVHNPSFGLKGNRAVLIRVSEHGYYEINLAFGESIHRTLLPVDGTMVIARDAEVPLDEGVDVEH